MAGLGPATDVGVDRRFLARAGDTDDGDGGDRDAAGSRLVIRRRYGNSDCTEGVRSLAVVGAQCLDPDKALPPAARGQRGVPCIGDLTGNALGPWGRAGPKGFGNEPGDKLAGMTGTTPTARADAMLDQIADDELAEIIVDELAALEAQGIRLPTGWRDKRSLTLGHLDMLLSAAMAQLS